MSSVPPMIRRSLAPALLAAAGGAAAVLAAVPALAGANMRDQLINHYCSQAMATDFAKAGKTPPAGMVEFTCGCVVKQVDARASIDQAKTVCRQQALQKYGTV